MIHMYGSTGKRPRNGREATPSRPLADHEQGYAAGDIDPGESGLGCRRRCKPRARP